MAFEQELLDDVLDSALKVFRLIAAEKRTIYSHLEKLKKELVGKLASEPPKTNVQVKKFLSEADRLIEKHFKAIQLSLNLKEISRHIARETKANLEVVLGRRALGMPTT